jgi:molybdate transport system substrate-binding protein
VALSGITSLATQYVLGDLAGEYARRSGTDVKVVMMGGVVAAACVRGGDPCDFVCLARDVIAQLEGEGHVLRGSATDVATCGVAVAVRAGSALPDISTEAAVRDAVSSARSVGYSTGPSGVYLAKVFDRWGIRPNLVQVPPGVPVGTLLARGEVALGFQQMSELVHVDGITIVGALPAAIQLQTTFTAAACASSRQPGAAREWLAFLASPATADTKRRHGMAQASVKG